jgi:signal transduction histidine kinase/CheY-like chemotaxis protein
MIQNILRRAVVSNVEVANSVYELRRDIASKSALVFTLIYVALHLWKTVIYPVGSLWNMWAVSLIVFPTCFVSGLLFSRRYVLGMVVFFGGLLAALLTAAQGFQDVRIYYLLCLFPAGVVITLGWWYGVAVQALLGGLAWALSTQAVTLLPITRQEMGILIVGGVALGLLAGVVVDTILTVGEWYVASFIRAQATTEENRQQRIQLAQVIKNLDQAYYRLQRTNADLVAAWKVAGEAERLKTEFATNISHELRTPLNLIAGFTEMMMTSPENYGDVPLPGAYRRDLSTIYRSTRHLLDLVDDVIDLARLDAGKLTISREDVDSSRLVQEAVAMVRSYIEAKGLNCEVEIEPNLPILRMDRLRVRQVLLNLLVNATRFTDKGGIHVSAQRERGAVRFSVRDTGRGIRSEEIDNLFVEFNPGEKPKDKGAPWHSGSGLGLPISKKFVDLHQGRMGVESELGRGTTIWFEIPLYDKEPASEARGDPDAQKPETPIFLTDRDTAQPEEQRLAVLVHPDRRLQLFLQRHLPGWQVQRVKSRDQLGQVAAEKEISALLLDSHEELVDPGIDVPMVAYPLPSSRRLAKALGVKDFLSKPVTREDLFEAIDRLQISIRRVLIVDDDAEMVNLVQRMLVNRISPQDCLEAGNGEEAWEILQRERLDLVLLDLMMPGMDGRELLEQMHGMEECPPVIVISALEEPASELVGVMYVIPPQHFSPARMLGLVKTVMDELV